MFFALLIEYAKVLFLEVDIKPSILAWHHIFKYFVYVSTKAAEFRDK